MLRYFVNRGALNSTLLAVVQVHWYRNDQLLRPSRRHEMKLTRDGVCSLRIRDVTADDAGISLSLSFSPLLSVFFSLSFCLSVHVGEFHFNWRLL